MAGFIHLVVRICFQLSLVVNPFITEMNCEYLVYIKSDML
ncbi:hypothetical protein A79_5929 [Vibrio parahaemolyticus AQ3810]|nr:hypothetical protein A79_5929 [Vibrio parahaemolyticus AQ3810]ETS22768.1 hypothetical protein D033_1395 [Vibrio parahaemolyticus B-265]ETT13324.1 hypothetical protein D026_0486 [Vibrio parahaemolyticus 605]ETX25254.1 hypothetical protein D037_1191 [Vibrio parahaemolyticus IDH02640]ETX58534.1 hypothetical protein D038_1102 [Vibrio parahaemolyticus IDH02189]ETX78817.1 hypothetical protein D034_0484 [Vibrio parahaemolyticus Peru-288]EVT81672.1 hypothetical protein D032_0035 [Vibrio parahaemol